jgi:hypothetical protein
LEPSDFWFFGHIKMALARQQFPGPGYLLTGIQEFLSEIQGPELELVFHLLDRASSMGVGQRWRLLP